MEFLQSDINDTSCLFLNSTISSVSRKNCSTVKWNIWEIGEKQCRSFHLGLLLRNRLLSLHKQNLPEPLFTLVSSYHDMIWCMVFYEYLDNTIQVLWFSHTQGIIHMAMEVTVWSICEVIGTVNPNSCSLCYCFICRVNNVDTIGSRDKVEWGPEMSKSFLRKRRIPGRGDPEQLELPLQQAHRKQMDNEQLELPLQQAQRK